MPGLLVMTCDLLPAVSPLYTSQKITYTIKNLLIRLISNM